MTSILLYRGELMTHPISCSPLCVMQFYRHPITVFSSKNLSENRRDTRLYFVYCVQNYKKYCRVHELSCLWCCFLAENIWNLSSKTITYNYHNSLSNAIQKLVRAWYPLCLWELWAQPRRSRACSASTFATWTRLRTARPIVFTASYTIFTNCRLQLKRGLFSFF